MITIKRCFAIFVGIFMAWACHAADAYLVVIQNVETGQFMQYHIDGWNNPTVTFSDFSTKPSDSDMKNSLWLVSSTIGGV